MLSFDFYESGRGETTVVTFPDKSIGIIDAFPSLANTRPDIASLIHGKKIRFICLTHPHDDHYLDLPIVFDQNPPDEFWHTIPDSRAFFYSIGQYKAFESSTDSIMAKFLTKKAKPLIDIFATCSKNHIEQVKLTDRTSPIKICDTTITFLAPINNTVSKYQYELTNYAQNIKKEIPDANIISAAIAFEYAGITFIHGGDVLAKQWHDIVSRIHGRDLPSASIFKIPHHGAKNAIDLSNPSEGYPHLFADDVTTITFGNSTHPDIDVFRLINTKAKDMYFLINRFSSSNPLNIPDAFLRSEPSICNNIVCIEINDDSTLSFKLGKGCRSCQQFPDCLK